MIGGASSVVRLVADELVVVVIVVVVSDVVVLGAFVVVEGELVDVSIVVDTATSPSAVESGAVVLVEMAVVGASTLVVGSEVGAVLVVVVVVLVVGVVVVVLVVGAESSLASGVVPSRGSTGWSVTNSSGLRPDSGVGSGPTSPDGM